MRAATSSWPSREPTSRGMTCGEAIDAVQTDCKPSGLWAPPGAQNCLWQAYERLLREVVGLDGRGGERGTHDIRRRPARRGSRSSGARRSRRRPLTRPPGHYSDCPPYCARAYRRAWGSQTARLDDDRVRWKLVPALRAHPADAPLLEEERCFRSKTARSEIEHAHSPDQQRGRRGARPWQPDRDLLPLTACERVGQTRLPVGREHHDLLRQTGRLSHRPQRAMPSRSPPGALATRGVRCRHRPSLRCHCRWPYR